jgi:hypothetical protein
MKRSIAASAVIALALAATASAQLSGASAGRGAIQFDGQFAFVDVACAKEEGDCAGSVSVATVEAPTVPIGGPTPFSVDAETTQRVQVPLTAAGATSLEAARQAVVLVEGAAAATRDIVRVPNASGIVPGQVEVSPQSRERSCSAFRPMSEIRVRGVECKDAKALIRSAPRSCGSRCTVRGFRCRATRSGKSALRYSCTRGEFERARWRRSLR